MVKEHLKLRVLVCRRSLKKIFFYVISTNDLLDKLYRQILLYLFMTVSKSLRKVFKKLKKYFTTLRGRYSIPRWLLKGKDFCLINIFMCLGDFELDIPGITVENIKYFFEACPPPTIA